ncbi:tautomerase family protein [Streptomyces iconiensis]|uniref:Tautomerase family protein n=1 Tax=Streptomyces iconiensis TaxID=1384038 RepID=A0ABT7A2U4_9ACTN|nr:tautomerase family protein [Streptomyces iconiensis]MDJ1135653.1 tautomerase family protein [Streptomyces iconiensis]
MPKVRIDLIRGRRPDELKAVADAAHRALVEVLGIPERDRFQLITEHEADHVIALDAGLGFERTDRLVMIQIFTQAGRTAEEKQHVFRAVAEQLGHLGIGGEDVFVSFVENGPQDWSFGFGRAQYTEGALPVPATAADRGPGAPQ